MALFSVPGWSVPAAPVLEPPSKKRKRPADAGDDKIAAATINFDRLMEKIEAGNAAGGAGKQSKKPKNAKKGKKADKADVVGNAGRAPDAFSRKAFKGGPKGKAQEKPSSPRKSVTFAEPTKDETSNGTAGKKRKSAPASSNLSGTQDSERPAKKKKNKQNKKHQIQPLASEPRAASTEQDDVQLPPPPKLEGLTKLQAGMKNSLDGARFRWINEILYKSDSEHAHQMMRENSNVYEEYHIGFRSQVRAWPTNPVAHYVSVLSSYPAKTVIADLGCGDAALARALVPKDMTVLSFDLVSDGAYVVEADICARIPLPGSDAGEEGEGHVVDVVVCALSLMGTNWLGCIREAWRILKPGGELNIAEVASRFTNVDTFISLISSVGFRLKSRNDENTHFTLFEFKKVARKPKTELDWEKLLAKGDVLKPCEYKRR